MAGKSFTTSIKEWMHPALLYLLLTILCYEASTTQSDVKTLLAQSNVDKTEIANLKEEVAELKQIVFFNSKKSAYISPSGIPVVIGEYTRLLFKHEEEFDVKKYIPRTI